MRYVVGLLKDQNAEEAQICRIVRATSADDAIATLMKAEDLPYVYAAYSYPVKRQRGGLTPDEWRQHVRCSVSGKVYLLVGQKVVGL